MARHARDHHADIFIPAVILMVIAAFTVGDIVRPAATSGLSETAWWPATPPRRKRSLESRPPVRAPKPRRHWQQRPPS